MVVIRTVPPRIPPLRFPATKNARRRRDAEAAATSGFRSRNRRTASAPEPTGDAAGGVPGGAASMALSSKRRCDWNAEVKIKEMLCP